MQRNHANAWYGVLSKVRQSLKHKVRRVLLDGAEVFAGHLGFREAAGRPKTQYEDGVVYAKSVLEEAR